MCSLRLIVLRIKLLFVCITNSTLKDITINENKYTLRHSILTHLPFTSLFNHLLLQYITIYIAKVVITQTKDQHKLATRNNGPEHSKTVRK